MFDPPDQRYRNSWKDASFDSKLMFGYHFCMMALFIAGQKLTIRQELSVTGLLVILLVTLSCLRRRRMNWHWPALSTSGFAKALFGGVALFLFLYAGSSGFPPSDPRYLPWYLAVLGIGAFGIMDSVGLVASSETEFLSACRRRDK